MTKILLVEDDKSLREIYGVRLLAEGYQITSAGDGEEALAMAVKERPDLIIADVMMPKISGFDMLDILRSTPETKEIKVIMMTALSSEDQRARGESLGANRYLVKSQVGIEDVVRTIHDVLADTPIASKPASQTFGAPAPSAIITTQSVPTTVPAPAAAPTPMPQQPMMPVAPTVPTLSTQSMPMTPPAAARSVTQIPVLMPRPETMSAPAPRPTTPEPVTNIPSAPIQVSVPNIASAAPIAPSVLPQPTAPFSTPSPTPLNNRTIEPMPSSPIPDIADRINQELNGSSMTPPPVPQV